MRVLISAFVVGSLAITSAAQQPSSDKKKEPPKETQLSAMSLEDLLAHALKDNPDIRVSEAKVREAEAELNRTKLAVLQKVNKAYHEIAAHRQTLAEAKERFQRAQSLHKQKAISEAELLLIRLNMQKAEAELAQAEAELPYLVGKRQPALLGLDRNRAYMDSLSNTLLFEYGFKSFGPPQTHPTGTIAEKIRKVLDTPITGEWGDTPAIEIVSWFGDKFQAEKVNFEDRARFRLPYGSKEMTITVRIKNPLPIGAALQLVEDLIHPHGRFIIREYGIVLADPDSLPPGAVFVVDFWKNKADAK